MTNGSVAVFDGDVNRHLRFMEMTGPMFVGDEGAKQISDKVARVQQFFREKQPATVDTNEVQDLKAYIRYTEAVAGIEVVGLDASCARFLDMPFYKTGRVKKDPIDDDDVQIVLDLLNEIRPSHIYVAGDLSDPHGTHRMCYSAIEQALVKYNHQHFAGATNGADDPRPMVWLYRGAWQEWEIDVADVFVPLSKADLDKKIEAIYKHESQKDRALFPGAYDEREFWQRARDRNRNTAVELDELGLPEFYAAEAFVLTKEM
jgi:glucosamine-6-phosphate deaminase